MNLLLTLLFLFAIPSPDSTEIKARPGGKVKIQYGAAVWKDEWEERIFDGMIWRLSASNPNRAEVNAGLIFDDAVVFPGEYNLGLVCRNTEEWDLVFHNDGLNWNAGPCEALTSFQLKSLEDKEAAKNLTIEMEEEQDGYLMRIVLGRRLLEKPFRTSATKTAKGKVGKHAFTSAYLEREDIERVSELIDEDEVCVARIESKSLESPLRCYLRGGEIAELAIWPSEDTKAPLFLEGVMQKAQTPSKKIRHSIRGGTETAELEFIVGENAYVFDLPVTLFEKKKE